MVKVGLALSGGGTKGFAHVGVLEVLERHNIPIDYIAGTSMGAVVGALYASGISVPDLKLLAKETKWKNLVDFTLPDKGILSGNKIENFMRILLKNKKFKDLNIPTQVVATDISGGKKVVFKKGDVASAVRASISLPSIFVPHQYKGKLLVDGGVLDPVPVQVVREMGADVVIAVDLSTKTKDVVIDSKTMKANRFLKKLEKKMIDDEIEEINKYVSGKKNVHWAIKTLFSRPNMLKSFIEKNNLMGKLKQPEFLRITANSFDMMMNQLSKYSVQDADFVIKPNMEGIGMFDFKKYAMIIDRGERATSKSIRKIKLLLK